MHELYKLESTAMQSYSAYDFTKGIAVCQVS